MEWVAVQPLFPLFRDGMGWVKLCRHRQSEALFPSTSQSRVPRPVSFWPPNPQTGHLWRENLMNRRPTRAARWLEASPFVWRRFRATNSPRAGNNTRQAKPGGIGYISITGSHPLLCRLRSLAGHASVDSACTLSHTGRGRIVPQLRSKNRNPRLTAERRWPCKPFPHARACSRGESAIQAKCEPGRGQYHQPPAAPRRPGSVVICIPRDWAPHQPACGATIWGSTVHSDALALLACFARFQHTRTQSTGAALDSDQSEERLAASKPSSTHMQPESAPCNTCVSEPFAR
ncbi:uncharacterized protein EI97DRAFT_173656 [Westerdykella ornata]|uniref:Uncharacterized protein n=1 Tax=Westerdykella ornata TaxID=318751 RepID=A0A6A6JSY6_WESOR|nr:uncharacterized protein EI97DRAFT_173656 [Westerdykella ornata]KAF2279354.1 hypothetical protein EI97DRAFT_173656 [Westerdykella ornata]